MEMRYMTYKNEEGQKERFYPITHKDAIVGLSDIPEVSGNDLISTEAASEIVGDAPEIDPAIVDLVNSLTAEDVGARSDDWMPTASDVGAMAQKTGYITGTIKEFVKSLKGNASGMVAYTDVSDASSEIPDGFLLYNRTDGFSGFVYFMAFYMGRFKFGHYDTTTDEINWGYGSDSFLPLTGGTLKANELGLGGGYGIYSASPYGITIRSNNEQHDASNSRGIIIETVRQNTNTAKALMFIDSVNGNTAYHQIYGAHNKPSGSYTGNGSATERRINIGGLGGMCPLLLIYCGHHGTHVLVSRAGAIGWNSTNIYAFPDGTLHFKDGVLIMSGTDKAFNENGLSYYWREL